MAITIKEIHDGRVSTHAGANDASETRSWRVTTDDKSINGMQIRAYGWSQGDFPVPFLDSHPDDPFYVCKSLDIRQQDDKGALIWIASARYDTRPVGQEDKEQQEQPDPTLRQAVYSGGFERDQKAVNKDLNDEAIVNSAGDPYLDPVLVPFTRQRIRGRMHVAPDAIPSWFYELKDKTNENGLLRGGRLFEPETLLFIPGDVTEPQTQNDVEYVTIHWELEVRLETWKEKRVDNGYNQIVYNPDTGVNDLKVPIEVDGARPTEPQLLDGDGTALTKDQIEAGEYFENEWDTVETADFSVLP